MSLMLEDPQSERTWLFNCRKKVRYISHQNVQKRLHHQRVSSGFVLNVYCIIITVSRIIPCLTELFFFFFWLMFFSVVLKLKPVIYFMFWTHLSVCQNKKKGKEFWRHLLVWADWLRWYCEYRLLFLETQLENVR